MRKAKALPDPRYFLSAFLVDAHAGAWSPADRGFVARLRRHRNRSYPYHSARRKTLGSSSRHTPVAGARRGRPAEQSPYARSTIG